MTVTEAQINAAAAAEGLALVGDFHTAPEDLAPEGIATIVLLGPLGDSLWKVFHQSPEFQDGESDPLDRWSSRVITALAAKLGARPFFPFGGPPYQPFIRWAAKGEPAFSSPVGMQVSAQRGLWSSYRGALGFAERLALTPRDPMNPCLGCPAPCLSACPVDAFAGGSYDVPRCVDHLKTEAGQLCREGCLVRRACPAGQPHSPPEDQRAFHMAAFLRSQG